MALNAKIIKASGGLVIPVVSADPGSPADGAIWYNSSDAVFRFREDGVTRVLGDAEVAALNVTFDNTTLTGDDRFTADNVQAAVSENRDVIENHIADTTDAHDSASIGYAGTADGLNVQGAIDEVDANVNDLITLSGVAENAADLGTFTGTTIPDSSSIKGALQALETEVETKADDSVVTEIDANVDDLITLSGVAENAIDLGEFTGATIGDGLTIKAALQALETGLESIETNLQSAYDGGQSIIGASGIVFEYQGNTNGLTINTTTEDYSGYALKIDVTDSGATGNAMRVEHGGASGFAASFYMKGATNTGYTLELAQESPDGKMLNLYRPGGSISITTPASVSTYELVLPDALASSPNSALVDVAGNGVLGWAPVADAEDVSDLITLSGVAENATDLGTFDGSTIPDSQTIKQALQALETEVETKADDADVIKKDGSVAFTADQSMGGFKITNLAAPSSSTDAVNKGYVDQAIEGLKPKEAVRVATTAPGTLASDFENGDSIDGVTLATGDRILLKDQADASENGIYVVQASGAPVRAADFDALTPFDEINGSLVAVQEGTDNEGKIFVQQGVVAEIDTDDINFVFFNSSSALVGGDGITVSGSNISVDHDGEGLAFSANQLALELDGSTLSKSATGVKVADAGITGTQLNTSVAGNGLSGGGGSALSVNVDDSTIEIATDALQVKDGGISNAKVATGIDAAKLADGSVSNTEFQYLANVSSDIQTQLNDKLDSVSEDTAPSLGGALDAAGQVIHDDTGIRLGETASNFYLHKYIHSATLTASQSDTALAALTFAHATWGGCEIEYLIKEATTNQIAKGRIMVATNGTDVDIVEEKAETGDIGVDWTAAVNGANIEIRYTTTANNKTGRFIQKLLAAI